MKDTKKLLLTGFDPFGGEKINPAYEAIKPLPDYINDYRIYKLQIPTIFGRAEETVIGYAEEIKPDVILCVGQAAGRSAVTPEIVAINLRYGKAPDNAGNTPQDEPVIVGGQAAYFSTLPVRSMAKAINEAGIKGEVSYSAGSYVCNGVFYAISAYYAGSNVRTGFIHVPLSEEQAKNGMPCMKLCDMTAALEAAINAI